LPGRHARADSFAWWQRQGYRRDHPVHSEIDSWVKGTDDSEGKFLEEKEDAIRGGPVEITVAPTKSTNPRRPRTRAMGYDYETDTLRVVFREGAVYDYFGVSTDEWWRMKRSASPGKFIKRVLDGHEYTRVQ
jgi:hypothetical protein